MEATCSCSAAIKLVNKIEKICGFHHYRDEANDLTIVKRTSYREDVGGAVRSPSFILLPGCVDLYGTK